MVETLAAGPFSDLIPATDLIGGENGAPAYQVVGGRFSEVPRARLNALPAPESDPFGDLASNTPEDDGLLDVGEFHDLVPQPPKPQTESEQALLETPNPPRDDNGWYIQPGSLPDRILTWFGGGSEALAKAEANRSTPMPAERPPLALPIAKAIDTVAEKISGQPGVLQEMVETRTQEPKPEGPSFMNAGIPMIPPQEGTAAEIAAGVANVPIGFANFLLSPGGVTTLNGLGLLPKAAQTLAGLGFTVEQIKAFFQAETLQDKVTSFIGATFLGYGIGRHAKELIRPASEPGAPPVTTERAVPETPQGAEPAAAGLPTSRPVTQRFTEPEGAPIPDESATTRSITREAVQWQRELTSEGQRLGEQIEILRESGRPIPAVLANRVNEINAELARGFQAKEPASYQLRGEPELVFDEPSSAKPSVTSAPTPSVANARAAEIVPENLRRSSEIDRLINEPEAQVGGQMKFEPATEGGAFGFGGGKRATVTAKGTTPRGDTEFLKIESALKRAFTGLERKGAADVIGETRNKVGKLLSDATRKQVDLDQELLGQLSNEFIRTVKSVPKKAIDSAFDEVAIYEAAKENGRTPPALSPEATKLVSAWENIAERSGKIAAANNVQVFDPATGGYRPIHLIGKQYVPRMFKPEVERVMRDPNSNPRLWNDLVDELAKHRGITDIEAANQLRAEAGRFSSNDFMGNLEMARTGKMPEVFYDYDLRNLAARYLPNFTERMAQIIAYGQRLGPRENPQRPNLWDIARKEAADSYTQDWLTNAENQAVNLRQKGTAATGMARLQTAASGFLLSSPTTTVLRNLLGGTSATPELLGVRRSMKGFADTVKSSQARMDAREIGAVRDNIADFLHADRLGDSPVDNAIRSVVDTGLKYSGYNGSEVFVRTHGTATASQFAKDAVAAINKNPASMRSKEALGLFKRTGVNSEKIVAENADWKTGPETRKFIRTFVRDTQGGYRFDQVPLWANSNMGRFFYQFGRWGTQRARNIWKNGIQPALGEEVQWHGKTMTRRDIRPLIKMLGTTVVLGETFAGIAQLLFGRDRRDASLSEIAEAWKEDEKRAVGLAFERVINDVIMAGTLGIWSQPIDWAKGLKDQSRLKNPTEPPGLSSIKAAMELGQNMIDQDGQVTKRDLLKFASSFTPGVKQVSDVARNVMDEPLYEAENDVKTLRNAAHRWGKQSGLDVAPRNRGNFRKSALAPEYEPIKEALLVGDSERAKFLSKAFLDKQPNRGLAKKNLKMSIRMSQPFRAGPYNAKRYRDEFKEWAKKNLSQQDWQQTERIQERYQRAAVLAELW